MAGDVRDIVINDNTYQRKRDSSGIFDECDCPQERKLILQTITTWNGLSMAWRGMPFAITLMAVATIRKLLDSCPFLLNLVRYSRR
jgi:hypothetical protein